MLLVTKPKGFLYVNADAYVPVEEIELDLVDLNDPKPDTIPLISFNGFQFETLCDKMNIPKQFHTAKSLSIRVRIADRKDKRKYVQYTADTLAVTKIVIVGQTLREGYPRMLSAVEARMTELEEKCELIEKALLEHVNAGSIL